MSHVLLIAHGLVSRGDLPIPKWLFGWAAALVLIASFAGLASLWPEPRLQDEGFRPLPRLRFLTSPVVEIACGAVGIFVLGLTVYAGLKGLRNPQANFAPQFVYVVFWVGFVPLSVVLGDVFRAFNPWRATGRAVAWVAQTAARGALPAPLRYPERLGRYPAAIGILLFAALELVYGGSGIPERVAIATLVYSAVTFIAMALYGVDAWIDRGEAFSVYYGVFSRMSVFVRHGRDICLRKPLSGLPQLPPAPGTVFLLAVMIGSITFDGAAEAPLWTNLEPHVQSVFSSLGFGPEGAFNLAFTVGLIAGVGFVFVLFQLALLGARTVGGGFSRRDLGDMFIHSLVPIALAYVSAHYLTELLFQGQTLVRLIPWPEPGFLVTHPLGHGTPSYQINYSLIGSNLTWYLQVAFVVAGHVMGLILAHDRALAAYDDPEKAVRSQYWMLAVMVGFTSLALWLLSQANV